MSLIVEEQNEIKAFKTYSHLCLNYHLGLVRVRVS